MVVLERLEVSTLARIIDSNTWRVRYHAGGHAEQDSIIQGCEEGGAFKIMSFCVPPHTTHHPSSLN